MNSNRLGKCPTCDHVVSVVAVVCPNCGETRLHETFQKNDDGEAELQVKSLAKGFIFPAQRRHINIG